MDDTDAVAMGNEGTGLRVRRLGAGDVAAYRAIRLAALRTDPGAFGSTYAAEAARPDTAHAERLGSSAVFAAYQGAEAVGMIGFRRHDGLREAHKGFLWGFYVAPGSRRSGVGRALLAAALEAAPGVVEQVTLTVVDGNAAAVALYERFGFERYGLEPRALKGDGPYLDEALMVLFFTARD